MPEVMATFAEHGEFEKTKRALDELGLAGEVISPDPGYALVGAPSLAMGPEARGALAASAGVDLLCAGWVDYRPANIAVPAAPPPEFEEDAFGRAAIMVLAPCVADETKIRIVAHISGDLSEVFPYLNAEMKHASYNMHGPTFTFMEGYRMISLYPRRIAVAKADEIVDAWRVLEDIRQRVNETWARRHEIEPSYERREKPPALEIYKRLPRTNCGQCGERACLAFAVKVWQAGAAPSECSPVFGGEFGHLKDALLEICRGLGVSE
jgi:ArsR family metal-binding transcriptional regulator